LIHITFRVDPISLLEAQHISHMRTRRHSQVSPVTLGRAAIARPDARRRPRDPTQRVAPPVVRAI